MNAQRTTEGVIIFVVNTGRGTGAPAEMDSACIPTATPAEVF